MQKIESEDEMFIWLSKSKKGQRAEYYRGYLLGDKQMAWSDEQKIKISNLAWFAYEQSLAILIQKRIGDFDYSYIIESLGFGGKLSVKR